LQDSGNISSPGHDPRPVCQQEVRTKSVGHHNSIILINFILSGYANLLQNIIDSSEP